MIELEFEHYQMPGATIKVVGIGGAGGNTINSIIQSGYHGVEFIVANTDKQALEMSAAQQKIHLGVKSTKGLGTGANPELGKRAAEEDLDKIMDVLEDADIVFLTAGMGGGTGSGALPVIAKALKDKGILCIAVVTKPFIFEGKRRTQIAQDVVEKLQNEVDTLIVVPNQKLLDVVDQNVSMVDAFNMINNLLGQSVKGIADIISKAGHINVDFADVRTIMKDRGLALMGTATARGARRAEEAVLEAISSPLLENMSIKGAHGVLLNVTGSKNLSLHEISQAASIVYEMAHPEAQIILGTVVDESLQDEVRVTIIATGFSSKNELKTIQPHVSVEQKIKPAPQDAQDKIAPARQTEQVYESIESDLDIPSFMRSESSTHNDLV
ncbi:cell division protein FtsZ [Candidatus Dependentiae bacterium Noda2021]|nr:cell division protein FtsZ [Candidatus Dependentiae bacterium Noda2021]